MVESLRAALAHAWSILSEQMTRYLPKIIVGILLLTIGFVLARVLRRIAYQLFVAIRLDRLSDRLGINSFLARGDTRHTLAEVLATLIYWFVLLFSLEVLGRVLGLRGVAEFFGQVVGYLPRLAAALAIIIVGMILGAFFGGVVHVAAANARITAARSLGRMAKYVIAFFALVVAMEQLGIVTSLLVTTLEIVIGAIAFALALAFGLGCKEIAGETVRRWLSRPQPDDDPERGEPPTPAS